MNTGSATKPLLGVQGTTSSNPNGNDSTNGAPISAVTPGSPAATAGLTAGEVVTKVGTSDVQNFADLIARIGSYAPGGQVALTVTNANGANPHTVNVTLGSQPDQAPSDSVGGSNQTPNPRGRSPYGQQNPFGQTNPFGGGN
jgi:putative serine protease PepD